MRSLSYIVEQHKDGEGADTLSAAQKTYLEKWATVRHTDCWTTDGSRVVHLEKSHPS